MASRRNIRNALLSELETAIGNVSGVSNLGTDDVYHANAEVDGELPVVTYKAIGSRTVDFNNGSAKAPSGYDLNNSGEVVTVYYSTYWRIQFDVRVKAPTEFDKEPIYRNILDHFEEFDAWKDSTDFHKDCESIDVDDNRDDDDESTDDTTPGDRLSFEIVYERRISRSVDPIRTFDTKIDIGDDGTVDWNI